MTRKPAHEKIYNKILKDLKIINERQKSLEKYMPIKNYGCIKIISKLENFDKEYNKLIEMYINLHSLYKSFQGKFTPSNTFDLEEELILCKEIKNKLYNRTKSINHMQGLKDLEINK